MVKLESLNPAEVLAHLNALGYYNIKPDQLKDFIHDLKKLIKYDQKRLSGSRVQLQISKSHSSDYESSCSGSDDHSDKLSSNESYESSDCSSSATYKDDDSKYDESDKNCPKSGVNLDRVQSSFIRPWNLPVHNLSGRHRKNPDPVKLYHQYREVWNRFNIPGEKKHSELRWGIRNRMLGQEPQPRVVI